MWHFWYPTRMLHLFCPVSSPFVKSYFGREFSWFLQQSFKLEMKNLFFGNLSGKNHPDWSLIKTLIYCFCWVFKHFSVQIFFTSYFEKHPSSTITAVHRLYHNNAPKVRDALYMASAKFFKVSPLSHTGIFDSDEVQSTDSPFSLPVRLKYGKCQVFSLCKSIFPHWDLWFRRETVIRLALFPACPKAEPWQLQSFLCRCKPTYAHWNLCSLNLRIAIAIIRPWKKFQSDFKYGEPFRHQMGA